MSIRSSINFRLPDTPPLTPGQEDDYSNDVAENWLSTPASTISGPPKKRPSLFEYDHDFPPLSREVLSKNFLSKTLNIWFTALTIFKIQLVSLIQIRYTLVTDNYLAAEEIQNQDWEYFIERVIEVCKCNKPSIRPDEEFLLSTIENVTIAKRVYTMIYNVIARNF